MSLGLCSGHTICHVHTPDSGTASKVKNFLGVLNGRKVQFVVKQHQEHVMGNVELIILEFIVRAPVLALPEFVITSTILISMSPNGGRNGSCVAQVI